MEQKNKIGLIAVIFAIIAISASAQTIYDSITCTNCILDNPTFINFSFGDTLNNSKVNKTGDNMSGAIVVNPDNINLSDTPFVASTDGYDAVKSDQNMISSCLTLNNNTVWGCFFGAYKAGWNATTRQKSALTANSMMFTLFSKGWDGTGWGSSTGNIVLSTGSTDWSSTSKSTAIHFLTTNSGTPNKAYALSILEDQNIKVYNLAGTGNAITQVDSTGKLVTNRTAGAGIPITSPDGAAHCIKVSNTNAITSSTGAC